MKRYGWIIALTLGLSMIAATTPFLYERLWRSGADYLCFRVFTPDGASEDVTCWTDDDRCYVFLPSYAELGQTEVRLTTPCRCRIGGVGLSDSMACDGFALDTDYELTVEGHAPKTLRFVRSANVAAIYIDTPPGGVERVRENQDHKERVAVRVYTADGRLDYRGGAIDYEDEAFDYIRGRGNYTWSSPKKPYSLHLHEGRGLLGMGARSDWALLANGFDRSNIRNKTILDLARRTGGYEGFAPDCTFAELYLNGEYAGLYLLCEKVGVKGGGLDVPEGGFLFALEKTRALHARELQGASFQLNQGSSVLIDWPDACPEGERERLRSHLLDFQAALLAPDGVSPRSGRAWDDFIDLDSWARKYLVEEVSANYDAGASSQYYHWDGADGRIYAGPCWDYDGCLGISRRIFLNGFLAQREWYDEGVHTPWFHELWKRDAFRDRVVALYQTAFSPELRALAGGGTGEEFGLIEESARNNALRWGQEDGKAEVEMMTSFLEDRIGFLDSAWIDGVQYHTVFLKTNTVYSIISVEDGAVCENLPSPTDLDVMGETTWYREDDDEPFDSDAIITEDVTLYLKERPPETSMPRRAILMSLTFLLALLLLVVDRRRGRREGARGRGLS